MNLATILSLAVFLIGALFAVATLAIAAAPAMQGLRFFSLACTCGSLYALSNATLASGSFAVSRWGIRFGLMFVALHAAAWFVYVARREGRALARHERVIVATCLVCAVFSPVPDLFYRSDERWVHAVPSLGISYIDARSTVAGDVVFAFFGFAVALLLWRSLRRMRTASGTERAEAAGLFALALSGLNDSLVTANVIDTPYLLDVGYLVLVVVVASALARRFVENANQLKVAQAELIARERLAALGEMSAVVAHEVRNPVAIIFNAAASMRKGSDRRDELLSIVEEEAARLEQMVTGLLDFAHPASVRFEEEPLAPIIQSAVAAIHHAHGELSDEASKDIEVTLAQDLPRLRCDVRLLRQAIVNLVSNALESPARKGPVRIDVGLGDREHVRLAVVDDGEGISADNAERIFSPFFTTRPTGIGLGLTVVKRIVEAHGGALALHATPGGGATFEMLLPI